MHLPDICRPALQSAPLTGLSDLGSGFGQSRMLISSFKAVFPRLMIRELQNRYIVHIMLDGLEERELALEVEDGAARVFGFVTSKHGQPMDHHVVMHRFNREVRLPNIDAHCSPKTLRQNGDIYILFDKNATKED